MTEIEKAIEERNWESLNKQELKEAEETLRERKNKDKEDRDFNYLETADKWIGVQKEMKNRGIEVNQ
jgi:hypothetical protein